MQEVVRLTSVRSDRGTADPARAWMSFYVPALFPAMVSQFVLETLSASWQLELRVGRDFVADTNPDSLS